MDTLTQTLLEITTSYKSLGGTGSHQETLGDIGSYKESLGDIWRYLKTLGAKDASDIYKGTLIICRLGLQIKAP